MWATEQRHRQTLKNYGAAWRTRGALRHAACRAFKYLEVCVSLVCVHWWPRRRYDWSESHSRSFFPLSLQTESGKLRCIAPITAPSQPLCTSLSSRCHQEVSDFLLRKGFHPVRADDQIGAAAVWAVLSPMTRLFGWFKVLLCVAAPCDKLRVGLSKHIYDADTNLKVSTQSLDHHLRSHSPVNTSGIWGPRFCFSVINHCTFFVPEQPWQLRPQTETPTEAESPACSVNLKLFFFLIIINHSLKDVS